jgi:redox-sensitive bicupin YhaK (pirin superfamily)
MRLVTGKVVAGKIEVEGEELLDGEEVGVLLNDDEIVALTPEQIHFLDESLADIEAGRFVDGPAFLRDLARRNS